MPSNSISISRRQREGLAGHSGRVIWFTGLSGAGKSTIAHAVEYSLYKAHYRTMVLDGDDVRTGLCSDLGYTPEDRAENMRRLAEAAYLLVQAGVIVLIAAIAPSAEARKAVRHRLTCCGYLEVYVKASVEACAQRDVKGLYAKARRGELPMFTGVGARYEVPAWSDITVDTEQMSLNECVQRVLDEVAS